MNLHGQRAGLGWILKERPRNWNMASVGRREDEILYFVSALDIRVPFQDVRCFYVSGVRACVEKKVIESRAYM